MTEWANYLKILKINILILEIKEETIQGGIILKEVGYLPCRHQDNKYKSDTLKHYMYYIKLWKLFLIVNYITESQLFYTKYYNKIMTDNDYVCWLSFHNDKP